jgi:uncharacterized protein (DUF302 family)
VSASVGLFTKEPISADHASAAGLVGLHLRPTSVFIFGNAVAGTPLMQMAPTIAIDLPLRMLVWTGEDGVSWLTYIDPAWLAGRHTAEAGTEPLVDRMRRSLTVVADHATGATFGG